MSLRLLPLLLFLLLGASPAVVPDTPKSGKDYAFLFYTADYTNGWTDLPETKARLPELATELRDNYNFEVETYGDLTLAKLRVRLAEINRRNFGPNDQVLFFFTGHGYYQEGSDNGYLIPSDGPHEWHFGDGWMSYDKLREYLSHNGAKHLLVAFDACHSGSFGRRTMGKPGPLPWEQDADCTTINRNSLHHQSRLFFSSGNKEERVPAQSEFLRRWLQCLRQQPQKNEFIITDDDLRGYVNTVTSSSPEDGYFQGHTASGKFVFIHKDACAPVVDPLKAADNAHWVGVEQDMTVDKANKHIQLYGDCPHYEAALKLLSGGATLTRLETIPNGMVSVPGGIFQMGDTFKDGGVDESPVHTVTISPFQMGRYEVTFAEYDRFTSTTGKTPAEDRWGRGQQPVISVSWFDAISYCNWLSSQQGFTPVYRLKDPQKQKKWVEAEYGMELEEFEEVTIDWHVNGYGLPTEAEWEFAASYVDGSIKARFGNNRVRLTPAEANFNGSTDFKESYSRVGIYREKTLEVGSLNSPNLLGIHDLTGNVWEWCSDWYSGKYYGEFQSLQNPKGPDKGWSRVLRGGSWLDYPDFCRVAARVKYRPEHRSGGGGFRLVRSLRR